MTHMNLSTPLGRVFCCVVLTLVSALAQAQDRRNWFDDPFVQVTAAFPGCPPPLGPRITEEEMRREAHYRAERGTTCWLEKRCAEPNAYLRDKPLAQAVVAALRAEPALADTSVWIIVQRKFVYLQGCVRHDAQAARAVALARAVPGIDYVSDDLLRGTAGKPPYPVATP